MGADLQKHVQGLGPQCGPANLEICDESSKKRLEEFQALSAEEREKLIEEKDGEIANLESEFKIFVETLNKRYQEETERKDKAVEAIKLGGLGPTQVCAHLREQEGQER